MKSEMNRREFIRLVAAGGAAGMMAAGVIGKNGIQIHTTEHILAALYGMEIDNALIQLDGPEIPIMDGSVMLPSVVSTLRNIRGAVKSIVQKSTILHPAWKVYRMLRSKKV